ncbi:MAG: hypothetical protein JXB29_02390 [Sedimentisphaerales bacterium]|nr:hypothetical protein [Sedimentisphaerales bacterium]
MNSKERITSAMEHKVPDRVPIMCQLALGHYFLSCEYKPSDIWFDSLTFARALVDMQGRYGFDGILVNLPGRPPDYKRRLKSSKYKDGVEHLYWKSGFETLMPPDDNPHSYQAGLKPLVRADYKTFDINDQRLFRMPGYLWNAWHMPELWDIGSNFNFSDPKTYPDWFTLALREVQQLAPDVSVHAEVFSPFTHLMEFFGYEQTLFALIDEPDKCHKLLDVFARIGIAQVDVYMRCRPDAILVSSAFAGAGFISKEMYNEFVAPYEDRVFQAVSRYGVKSYVHTCGAIGDRLDLMAATSVDGIDTLDPPPLGTVDLAEAKSKYGRRFFFKGNLDAVNEMLYADDQTFDKAVKGRIRIGKPGSGYILSSACSVAPHVKPARLKRMVELAKEFGRY